MPSAEEMWADLMSAGVDKEAGACDAHEACLTPHPVLDITGSPCQLWSAYGKRRGKLSRLIILLLCWALWFRCCKVLVGVHENVKRMDIAFVRWLLGDVCEIITIAAYPSQVGLHFLSRSRLYIVVWLRQEVKVSYDIADTYRKVTQGSRSVLNLNFVWCGMWPAPGTQTWMQSLTPSTPTRRPCPTGKCTVSWGSTPTPNSRPCPQLAMHPQ